MMLVYPERARSALNAGQTPRPRLPGIPWSALLVSIALVVTAAAAAAVVMELRSRNRTERATAEVVASVERRMDMYVALLRGTAGLYAYDPGVDRDGFRRFVSRLRLDQYPGVQGIGWTLVLTPSEASRVVEEAHAAGVTSFHLWPEHDEVERHAIVFLEPSDARNLAALGYDMYSEPARRAAMDRARDEGRPAATGIVRLVQEIEGDAQPGFLVYVPMYAGDEIPRTVEERRARLRGFAYAPFRAGDLFNTIFAEQNAPPALTIDDGPVPDPAQRLFELDAPGRYTDPTVARVVVAGREWTLEVRTPCELISDARVVTIVIVFVGALLTAFVVRSSRARLIAEAEQAKAAAALAAETEQAQIRETFLGVLGHDLRNPLFAAKANAQLMLRSASFPEERRAGLTRIVTSVERASRLVEQLLDITRARLGGGIKIDARPLALAPLVRDVVEEACVAHPRRVPIELALDDSLVVLADPDRLAQILSNLITNALTHGSPPLRVTARASEGWARIEVTNGGAPIPKEVLATLFDPFKRGDSARDHAPGGLGLGLYISHELALSHGGSLEALSDAENGTRFVLRLRLA
ncbi:CHASE domain-containing protein [Polyangium spumosum]|uniref:histidine kinase n=1 Tax=Polyangium spumosum TaxID=889282 RepID=A0A6N7PXA8_9BACT|nr:CHASE domain-containing protein [Polyangium spumosum]MRG96718.1 hypothetical protein [Polyangium spumosum]